jgi:hypothetical protein
MSAAFDGSIPADHPVYELNGNKEKDLLILQPIASTYLQAFMVLCQNTQYLLYRFITFLFLHTSICLAESHILLTSHHSQ